MPGAAIRASATLVVLRDAPAGMEVLLLRRVVRDGDVHSGACVFPGGLLDESDALSHACCDGLDDARASALLGLERGGLSYFVAALRECFEEAGLLYAVAADGGAPGAAQLAELAGWREPLNRGERHLHTLCAQYGLRLTADRLAYFSHWLTPPGVPKRYDTRFFVAEAPALQVASQDTRETVEQLWIRPADALADAKALHLVLPTLKTLQALQAFDDVGAVMAHARAPREVPRTMPRLGRGAKGVRPVHPDEPAWAELGRLDPEGRGTASFELTPGVPVRLSPRLIRVTANNGSMMTGPGTNTYLLGGGAANEWAAIDPGPADAAHVQAILDAAPGPIRWIFVTHTHKDHSPAAAALKARTGATLLGMPPLHAEWQDTGFAPDTVLRGGELFELPGDTRLQVIHTPGHAGNHLCYLLEQERLLFTGDHVMQGSTVVINPPDGDMAAYLHSLGELKTLPLDWLAPGHGFLMAGPGAAMQRIIEHRLKREATVLAALPAQGSTAIDALLAVVYADVPERLHAMARRSLLAHLLKLQHDRLAVESPQGHWARLDQGLARAGDPDQSRPSSGPAKGP